jgi:integrase
MAASNLTDKTVLAAKPGKFVTRLYDKKETGLILTITPAGSKSWALGFTSPETRKRRFYKLGDYPGVGLAKARKLARDARDLLDRSIDPIEEDLRVENAERQAEIEANTGTVKQMFKLYCAELDRQGKYGDKYLAIYRNHIKDVIGHMKAREVTKDDVEEIIETVAASHPVQANRVRSVMLAAFNFGLKGYTSPHNPYRAKVRSGELPDFALQYNPVAATERNKSVEGARKRHLSKDEVKRLWNSIGVDALSSDLAIAVKLLLLTGQRVLEVLKAEWGEFDLDDKVWVIPAGRRKSRHKVDVDHVVPLTDIHVELLEELRGITGHDVYLFPHKDGEKPRGADSLSQAIYRYCRPGEESKRKPFEPFVPKDLRRTWKTLAGSIGLSLDIRNRVQGHAFSDIGSRHYDQWDYMDEKREAVGVYSAWLERLVTSKKTDNVVELSA